MAELAISFNFVAVQNFLVFLIRVGSCRHLIEIAKYAVVIDQTFRVIAHVDSRLSVPINIVVLYERIRCATAGDPRSSVLTNVVVRNVRGRVVNQDTICIFNNLVLHNPRVPTLDRKDTLSS